MKAGIAVQRSGVRSAFAFGLLMLIASARGQGLVEDFNAASGSGGATVFSGSGFHELDGWDDGLVGEWAYGGTFGDGAIDSVDASGSTTAGVGGSGAALLSVTGATFLDGGWFAGLFWPGVTLPLADPAQMQLTADILGSDSGGAYQLRLEGYRLVPFGLNENFDNVQGSAGHTFFNSASGPTGWMENWDEGISGEEAFAGFNGGGTVNGGVMALGVTDGGVGGSGAGQLIVTDLAPSPGGSWYAGLAWPGQMLPTTDLTQVNLTATIKGEINGGTLGDYMLRIEDADIDFLAFKMTANGEFQEVGGPLSDAIEDGVGTPTGDGLFDPTRGPLSVVVVFDNDLSDTWGSGGKITVDNLELTGGETGVLLGAVSFDGVADGSAFQTLGGALSTGNSTFVNVSEDFAGVVGPGPSGGVFFDATSGFEGYIDNWDDGIKGEAAFAGIAGLITVNGDARALGTPTGGAGGTAGGRLRITGLNAVVGCDDYNDWWGGLSWAQQHMPDGALADISLIANVKGSAVSGGTAGNFTLRIEDSDLDYLSFTLPSNGQFRTIGGALSNALPGAGFGPNSDGVFDRTHGPFTVVVAFDNPCAGWGPGGQLDVDNLTLTQAAFGTGVDTWSVAVSFADEMLSWGPGGTLTVDNLGLTEFIPLAPDPLVAVDGGNRYLRVSADTDPGQQAIRVTFVNLDGYPEPAPLYAGAPVSAPEEDQAKPGQTFAVAPLSCTPHFTDWTVQGTIAIYGAEIMPGSTYEVQRANADCPNLTVDEACWSDPVTITTLKYGDVWANFYAPPPAPQQPDFGDIAAMVRKFQGTASKCNGGSNDGLACADDLACSGGTCDITAPLKSTSQLQPNSVFPSRSIDFKDIAADVGAFTGSAYSAVNSGPCTCPSSVACGATSCTNDLACGGGLCVNGFCGDACGRCATAFAK